MGLRGAEAVVVGCTLEWCVCVCVCVCATGNALGDFIACLVVCEASVG